MRDLVIRHARANDAEPIADGNLAMARETEGKQLDPDTVRRGVRAILTDPAKGFYLVAEQDRHVVGQLMITYEWSDWRNASYWWVQSVYVAPDARRAGVFRALFSHLADEARRTRGVCGLRLYVEKENRAAQATYAALGMRRTRYHLYEVEFPRASDPPG